MMLNMPAEVKKNTQIRPRMRASHRLAHGPVAADDGAAFFRLRIFWMA